MVTYDIIFIYIYREISQWLPSSSPSGEWVPPRTGVHRFVFVTWYGWMWRTSGWNAPPGSFGKPTVGAPPGLLFVVFVFLLRCLWCFFFFFLFWLGWFGSFRILVDMWWSQVSWLIWSLLICERDMINRYCHRHDPSPQASAFSSPWTISHCGRQMIILSHFSSPYCNVVVVLTILGMLFMNHMRQIMNDQHATSTCH